MSPVAQPRNTGQRIRIGVFDSGVGGLTVLRELLDQVPAADYLYLGDTARLPYGSKSQETIARYAVSSSRFLVEQGADLLVIACNTASALALDEIREASRVPVIGVIETGANAARANSATGDVLVIATAATVESHAYRMACQERGLRALEKACPLLVPLVEEGWIDHPVTRKVIRIYLAELLAQSATQPATGFQSAFQPDTLVLGCTHYPLLRSEIERTLAAEATAPIRVIDSAEVTASQVAEKLGLQPHTSNTAAGATAAACRFYATDSVTKFRTLGERFLARPVANVEHIDLGG